MNHYQLNTDWCLWYHSINDINWKKNSYKNLYTIQNLYDIKSLQDTIQKIHLQNLLYKIVSTYYCSPAVLFFFFNNSLNFLLICSPNLVSKNT